MIQNSELNAIIERAIKTLREKKEKNDKKGVKEDVECEISDITVQSNTSEQFSNQKYFKKAFQVQLESSLKNHSKVRFDSKRGFFYFNKR